MHVDETVDHPAHYGGGANPYEAIKVIEAWGLGFCLGNTVKYLCRAGKKGDELEDLEKAAWYLNRRIKQVKSTQLDPAKPGQPELYEMRSRMELKEPWL